MTLLATLKKLFLGETWLLPVGIVVVLAATLVLRNLLADWHTVGGFVLLAGVLSVLILSVARSAKAR